MRQRSFVGDCSRTAVSQTVAGNHGRMRTVISTTKIKHMRLLDHWPKAPPKASKSIIATGTIALPESLSVLLMATLLEHPEALQPDRLRSVKERAGRHVPLDYEHDIATFAYLYYGANFAKAYFASRSVLGKSRALRILDLGVGAGASLAGVVTRLAESGGTPSEVFVVDKSAEHLDWYRRTTGAWLGGAYPQCRQVSIQDDALAVLRREDLDWDVIVASYIFCELDAPKRDQLLQVLCTTRGGRELIVIDAQNGQSVALTRADGWQALDTASMRVVLPFLSDLRFDTPPRYCQDEAVGAKGSASRLAE